MPSEADTCRMFVVPKLPASGWESEPHSILGQCPIAGDHIVPQGKGHICHPPKCVNYSASTDHTNEKVRSLCATSEELSTVWLDLKQRDKVLETISDREIDFQTIILAGKPDTAPIDLLCHLAYNALVLTRRQRTERMVKQEINFFSQFRPEAQEILVELMEKHAEDRELHVT